MDWVRTITKDVPGRNLPDFSQENTKGKESRKTQLRSGKERWDWKSTTERQEYIPEISNKTTAEIEDDRGWRKV